MENKEERHQKAYKVRRMQGEILTARPEGMDYEVYRQKRKEQQVSLKKRLRGGFVVWNGSWGTLVGRVPRIVMVD